MTLSGRVQWDFTIPYMTGPEAAEFQRDTDAGKTSIFRTTICARRPECGNVVPKGKEWCSQACYNVVQERLADALRDSMRERLKDGIAKALKQTKAKHKND